MIKIGNVPKYCLGAMQYDGTTAVYGGHNCNWGSTHDTTYYEEAYKCTKCGAKEDGPVRMYCSQCDFTWNMSLGIPGKCSMVTGTSKCPDCGGTKKKDGPLVNCSHPGSNGTSHYYCNTHKISSSTSTHT